MKKTVMILTAFLLLAGIGITYSIIGNQASQAVAAEISCPKCSAVIAASEKPVVSMLAGQKHACPSCGKEYSVAGDQTAHDCAICGGEVMACPMCGKTELIQKA